MSRPSSASTASRRYRQEEALVRRRNAQQDYQELWNGVSRYFHSNEVQCAKHEEWTSPGFYTSSVEAWSKAAEAEKRTQQLAARRDSLAQLLREEARQHELEMKALPRRPASASALPDHQPTTLQQLRDINVALKRREEENRRRQAELLQYHQWRQKQPAITEFQRRQHGRYVRDAWTVQCEQRQDAEQERRQEEQEAARREREEREREEERERSEEAERRRRRAHELQEQLSSQIQELKEQEAHTEELKQEEARVVQRRIQLEEACDQRRLAEERRRNQELGTFLHRQYQLKLRRHAKEVQEALAEDLQLLALLLASVAEDKTREDQRRAAARQEMEEIQHQLQEQARQEKERERQMAFMFHEEARRMWDQQEARWRSEQEARSKLVAQVLAAQQTQVAEKLKHNREAQRSLLRSREELLAQVEAADQELQEATAHEERTREQCRHDIDRQVAEKERRRLEQVRREQEEAERQREELRREEERIQQELSRMAQQGYRPQSVGRRRILW